MSQISNASDPRAEAAALGSLLWDDEKSLAIADDMGLNSEHFFSGIHAQAWDFLSERFRSGESMDLVILLNECGDEVSEIGGPAALVEWRGDCSHTNFEAYAKIIIEKSKRRDTSAKMAEAFEAIEAGDSLTDVAEALRESYTVADSALVACRWNIAEGSDYWTDDASEIEGLADSPIIAGLLREREIVQLVGAAKSQKTWLSLHLAVAVATGGAFMERATSRKKVLYIDYELKTSTFKRRLSMVAERKPIGLDVLTLRGNSSLPSMNDLSKLIKKRGYGLVIVDSLYRTGWLSEENDNDAVSRELTGLQKITTETGASLVVVDHTAKGGGRDRSAVDSSRGASSKGGFFDGIWVLRPQEKAPAGENRVLFDAALRDFAGLDGLPVLKYDFTATSCRLSVIGEADKSDVNGSNQAVYEAVSAMGADGGNIADISKDAETAESTTRRVLKSLVENSKVIEFPDPSHKQRKKFRVVDMGDDQTQTTPK